MSQLDRFARAWLVFFAVLAFVHSAIYALNNPVFEAPDEPYHLEYINYIARTGRLPVQTPGKRPVQYAHHFPLYYILASPVSRLTAGGEITVVLRAIPPRMDWPHFLHDRDPFPDGGSRIGFYSLRLLNSLFVALAVFQIGRTARVLLPTGKAFLVPPCLAALLPQLAFIGGSISNDPLTLLLSATALLAILSSDAWFKAGLWVGAAVLVKKSALVLLPGLLFFAAVRRKPEWRPLMMALAGALLVLFPLLLRNQLVYGDLLLNQVEVQTLPELVFPQPLDSEYFLTHMPEELPRSFVAHFGWMAVRMPDVVVRPWEAILALLLLASLPGLVRAGRRRVTLLLCLIVISNVVALVIYNLTFPQPQGRLLFPSLPAMMLLCALGARQITSLLKLPTLYLAAVPLALYLFLAAWTAYDVNNIFYREAQIALEKGLRDDIDLLGR